MNKTFDIRDVLPPASHLKTGAQLKKYTLAGVCFGLVFPLIGTLMQSWIAFEALTLSHLLRIQQSSPLLWIINTAPFCIGMLAAFCGYKQDQIESLNSAIQSDYSNAIADREKARNYLANILESIGDLVILINREGRITKVNISVTKVLGYQQDELIGQPLSSIIGQSIASELMVHHPASIFDLGFQQRLEGEFNTAYGHTVSLSVVATHIWDEKGQILETICVAHDISERKKREAMIEQSKRVYESLFNSSPIPIVVYQKNKIVFHNKETENLLDFAADKIRTWDLKHFIHSEDMDSALEAHQKVISGVHPAETSEFRLLTPSNQVKWLELRSTCFDWNGEAAVLSFIIDITDRREMELTIQQSEKKYRELVESINTIVMRADNQFRFTFLNRYGLEFFGFKEEEILGKSVMETIVPEVDSSGRFMKQKIDDIISNPNDFTENENENIRSNGEHIWVAWRNTPVFDYQGNLIELLSTGYDITARKNAEHRLKQKTSELEERVKELDCLYAAAELGEQYRNSPGEFLQATVDIIPKSMQFPDICCARLMVNNEPFFSRPFTESDWRISEPIMQGNTRIGNLDVFYLEECPAAYFGPFLKDEVKLIRELAKRISMTLERIALETAVTESEYQYKIIFNNAPIALFVVQDKKLQFTNPQTETLLGYNKQELTQKPFMEFIFPGDKELVYSRYRKRLNGDTAQNNYQFRIVKKSGKVRWVEIFAIPFTWKNRSATLSFLMDITDRLAAENKIREQNIELKAAHRQINSELEQARLAQLTLLSGRPPVIPGINLATTYHPMVQIGGDFYDIFEDESGRLGIAIGDVTGHGIPAALLSFLFLTTFKNARLAASTPCKAMEKANAFLSGKLPEGKYASMFYCTYNHAEKKLAYSSAGHPPAFLIRPGFQELKILNTRGTVLGMFAQPTIPFESGSIEMNQGDKILVYTDGMVEIINSGKGMLSEEALETFILDHATLPVKQLVDAILEFCRTYNNQQEFNDDVTLIGFEVL